MGCRSTMAAASVVVAALAGMAQAAVLTQDEPPFVQNRYFKLYLQIRNDDTGAVYNIVDINLYASLVPQLQGLPHNAGRTAPELVSAMNFTLVDEEGLGPEDGWYPTKGTLNPATLYNRGGICQFDNTQQASAILSIPTSLLDGNGDGWSATDPADYRIVFGASMATAAVASDNNALTPDWPASGFSYAVVPVPEPLSAGLLGAVSLLALARRPCPRC